MLDPYSFTQGGNLLNLHYYTVFFIEYAGLVMYLSPKYLVDGEIKSNP